VGVGATLKRKDAAEIGEHWSEECRLCGEPSAIGGITLSAGEVSGKKISKVWPQNRKGNSRSGLPFMGILRRSEHTKERPNGQYVVILYLKTP